MTILSNIAEYIPQRPPMLLVDQLVAVGADESGCTTILTVRDDNVLTANGYLTSEGVIEHMAQSASALAGFRAREHGAEVAPVGFIGEVKNFSIERMPRLGDTLRTEVTQGISVGEVTTMQVRTFIMDECVAQGLLKIAMSE